MSTAFTKELLNKFNDKLKNAFEEGRTAFKEDKLESHNPYVRTKDNDTEAMFLHWRDGYRQQAKRLKESKTMVSRFNLWEKVETDNPEEDLEKEITDEVPEDEEDVEKEVEGEEEETLYNLMADFILALPEESIGEDLKGAYEAVIERIGDEYLVGEEGESESDSEGSDESIEDEEEIKESKSNNLENPYKEGSEKYNIFNKFKQYGKGSAKIGFVSKNVVEREVAEKFLDMLEESLINESKEMTGVQLAKEIENVAKKYFPESYVRASFDTKISPSIHLKFAIGKDKSEWSNGIIHNDPAHNSILIWGFDKEGNQKSELTMSSSTAGYSNWKTGTKNRCGWRDIKKGGTAAKILKALDNYFNKLKEVYQEDGGKKSLGLSESKELVETKNKNITLELKKDKEWDEWQVKVFVDGKYSESKTYPSGGGRPEDKEDAIGTLKDMKKRYEKAGNTVTVKGYKLEESTEFKQVVWKKTTVFDRL